MVQLICEKGHRFEKSSSCRTCPTCERQRLKNLLPGLAAPAKRALLAHGIEQYSDVVRFSKSEVAQWHGIGKTAVMIIEENLTAHHILWRE
jgi:hypothetical protein